MTYYEFTCLEIHSIFIITHGEESLGYLLTYLPLDPTYLVKILAWVRYVKYVWFCYRDCRVLFGCSNFARSIRRLYKTRGQERKRISSDTLRLNPTYRGLWHAKIQYLSSFQLLFFSFASRRSVLSGSPIAWFIQQHNKRFERLSCVCVCVYVLAERCVVYF